MIGDTANWNVGFHGWANHIDAARWLMPDAPNYVTES